MIDIFDTQEDLAQEIACSLKSRLGCKNDVILAKHYPDNVTAYNLYLKGRFLSNKFSFKKAIAYYEQAIKLDSDYALAYCGLAVAYERLAFWYSDFQEEFKSRAKLAALKALSIDNSLPEAYVSMGSIKLHYEWEWKGAKTAFEKAISLNSGNAMAHSYYGHLLRVLGDFEGAVSETRTAHELDPISPNINIHYGMMLRVSGQIDKAIDQFRKVLEFYPNNFGAQLHLGMTYIDSGQQEKGIKLLEQAVSSTKKRSPLTAGFLGYAYGLVGNEEKATTILNESLEKRKQRYFSPHIIALIYNGLSNADKAFEWLKIAVEERDPVNFSLRTVEMFKNLHPDPRWSVLMKKMGFEG